MRIAYVCHWNLDAGDGVAKKVETQTTLWREAGHDVVAFALAPGEAHDRDGVRSFPYGARRAATRELARAVRAWRPDVLYLRYDLFLPAVWRLVRALPTVVEVNSDDRAEYVRFVKWRGRRALLYNEVNRRALLRGARAIVYVTDELAASESFRRYRAPHAVIANGVALGPVVDAAHDPDRPRAIFLGSPLQAWHGVDKLAGLARALPELAVDLIGYTREQLQRTVPDIPPNVTVHGRLTREEYEPLLAAADVGIGTLALHRKGMEQAAPLKVREYLAAGLPVVIAYDDVDLRDVDAWWLLRLPNTADNVVDGTGDVGAFVERVRGRRVQRAEVEQLIGWRPKEQRRLELFSTVARP